MVSLICACVNVVFAIHAFSNDSLFFGIMCSVFAALCFNNYRQTL